MKDLKIIVIFFLLSSCGRTNTGQVDTNVDTNTWNINLGDSFGNLQIQLPKQFDTLFSWTQYSDCGDACAMTDYRVQNKRLPVFKESGYMYFPLKDSVDQFTIKLSKRYYSSSSEDFSMVNIYSSALKTEVEAMSGNKFIIDTLITAGKHYFAVIGFKTFDTTVKANVQMLNAMTTIKGNIVRLFFEYRKSYTDSLANEFIKNSFEALKTIRISNSK